MRLRAFRCLGLPGCEHCAERFNPHILEVSNVGFRVWGFRVEGLKI